MGHFSAWAGGVALAMLVIPVVVRTTEDMLALVPNSLREAATALELPAGRLWCEVGYRAARAGIVTGDPAGDRPHHRRDGTAPLRC